MSQNTSNDEQTPLIAVVHTQTQRRLVERRPSAVRRICSSVLATLLILSLIAILITLLFVPECETRRHRHDWKPCIPKHPMFRPGNGHHDWNSQSVKTSLDYDKLVDILTTTPNEAKAKEWSQYYTSGPHLAGKNLSQAEWTKDRWDEFGVPHTEIVAYDTYINYPVDHRLALLENHAKKNSSTPKWKVKYEASLTEDVLEEDGTSGLKDRIPTFHGYSASGNVTAPYVFVNYGTYQDYEDLVKANITLKGKIALAKYGHVFRGLKIKRAQELGMVGVVIYTDPGDDGDVTEANGNGTYPNGPARHPSSVQRGSAQFLSFAPGDPTTPGYPSKPGVPRQPANISTPSIPSLPISYLDAVPLLKALKGHGPKAKSLGTWWKDGGLGYLEVDYYIGPSPDDVQLNLYNEQEYTITPLWNVIGVINGTLEDEVIVLGNHRDAWIAGGAGDPNSGSAALNEVIRSFGVALAQGWKPLRTIVFASWDGEEYGLIGSTEWVEEFLPWLNKTVIAYLNVDVGTTGPYFKASASPLLEKALIDTTKLVLSPNQTVVGQTIYDVWNKHISTMGSGSDFTAFQDYAGIASLDMGFTFGKDTAVYQYHSNYDSFDWMDKFGDPGWHYHVTIARLWALLAARISETPIVPLNVTDYTNGLKRYLSSVRKLLDNKTVISIDGDLFTPLDRIDASLKKLHNASLAFDAAAAELQKKIEENPLPWWRWWERIKLRIKIQNINTQYKLFERQFLYSKGLDGRTWFKHVVFAPGRWTGYSGATFPGLVEAIEDKDNGRLYKWAGIIQGLIKKARAALVV